MSKTASRDEYCSFSLLYRNSSILSAGPKGASGITGSGVITGSGFLGAQENMKETETRSTRARAKKPPARKKESGEKTGMVFCIRF